jgi:hypothetical protein
MSFSARPLRILPLLMLGLLGAFAATAARADDDVRFSATLTPEQRAGAGLTQLSEDNVAVIDGLVRQDLAASKFKNNNVDHTRFSQRRTAHERTIAGLDRLTPAQVDRLDALIRLRITGPEPELASTLSTSSGTAGSTLKSVKYQRPLEIHGEISYTYGMSKAGSFQGGGIALTYDDPDHRYSVAVAYSEYRGKGLLPYCFYPGGAPYRPYADGLPPAP